MKAYTDIEQSKKLAEILPIGSADMFWADGERPAVWNNKDISLDEMDIPCWSLAALLNYFRAIDFFPTIDADTLSVTMIILYYNEGENRLLNPVRNIKVESDDFIDACYEWILKLKEKDLL